jgi:hypothetical protein
LPEPAYVLKKSRSGHGNGSPNVHRVAHIGYAADQYPFHGFFSFPPGRSYKRELGLPLSICYLIGWQIPYIGKSVTFQA